MLSVSANEPNLANLLRIHPRVTEVHLADSPVALSWDQNGWKREIRIGDPGQPLKGLVELMDNNPLVCADSMSLPGPAATLALVALGPVLDAGIVIEAPTFLTNIEADEDEIGLFLTTVGWEEGVTVMGEPKDMEGVVAATAICAIKPPERLDDIDDIFEERYSRSFFVRRDESAEWHVQVVQGKPWAAYRLRIAPDEPNSLLTIQVMADGNGKCGAAQVVHAFNVMCGFEESLGVG